MAEPIVVGDCVLTLFADDRVRVERADPRVMVSAEIVHDLREGNQPRGRGITLKGGLLRIEGVNQTVVYRIGEKLHDQYAYLAEWPD